MRFELLVLFASGCNLIDIAQPIAVIASGLTDDDAASLEEGARCWNLMYGTQFVTGDADQQVEAFYDEQTCLIGAAQVQAGWPLRIGVCPPRYWNGIRADAETGVVMTSFRVFAHELGHVLNINGHPAGDPYATMRSGNDFGEAMFTDADTEILAEFNSGVASTTSCKRVVRSVRVGTQGTVGSCGCEVETALDLSRPIVVTIAPEFDAAHVATLQRAAECWSLRYGMSFEFGDVADGQVAHVEPMGIECRDTSDGRARDGDRVIVCAYEIGQPFHTSAMRVIGNILGVQYGLFPEPIVFGATSDARFKAVYPNQPFACPNVRVSGSPSVCSCVP